MAKNLILWLVIAVVLMMVFQNISGGESATNKLAYSTFLEQVKRGDIKEVTIDQSTNEISGVRNNNDAFVTQIPYLDMKLMDELLMQGNVIVSGKKPEEQSFLASLFINWFPMRRLISHLQPELTCPKCLT